MELIKPIRRKHTCHQTWLGSVSSVFPLLCPVKEMDWIPGWLPRLVVSGSGGMEKNCLFVERDGEGEAIWVVTDYEKNRFLSMYRILPGVTVSQFYIRLSEGRESTTEAEVSYEHTALGEAGEKVVAGFSEENFLTFMAHFEAALNYYLTHGELIRS